MLSFWAISPQQWSKLNFSLQNQYNVKQLGNDNKLVTTNNVEFYLLTCSSKQNQIMFSLENQYSIR